MVLKGFLRHEPTRTDPTRPDPTQATRASAHAKGPISPRSGGGYLMLSQKSVFSRLRNTSPFVFSFRRFFCVFYLGPPSISRGPVASGEPPEATSPRPGGQAAPRPGGQAPVMGGWGGGTLRAA